MGKSNSKMDLETMETIETNVVGPIIKIGEEEGKIDRYVQQPISEEVKSKVEEIERKFEQTSQITTEGINELEQQPIEMMDTTKEQNKKLLFEKGMDIVTKLDKIEDENKVICENILDTAAKTVNQIDTDNNEVQIQKNEIGNRTEGYLIVESLNYLRQLKEAVDNFKMYAQKFAFPKSIKLYEIKRQEIQFLGNHLDELPKGRQCIDDRVHVIQQEINRALEVLEEKVEYNGKVLNSLEFLDNLAKEAVFNNDSSQTLFAKLWLFNEIRRRIEEVDSFNPRLCTKKIQIRSQLHSLEEKIYFTKYPEWLRKIKALLNEHEKDAQQFLHPITSEMYEQKRNEIHILMENINKIICKDDNSLVYLNILKYNFKVVLELLQKTAKENTERIERLMEIDSEVTCLATSNIPASKQLEFLGQYESFVKKIKTNNIQKTEVFNAAETTETKIMTEKSRIELTNIGDNLKQLKENVTHLAHPIDSDTFRRKINEIFCLKEHLEDMPEGNAKLDSLKQSFLGEISIILNSLDEHVAHVLVSRKKTENILDLKNHFDDFNPLELGVPRESQQFVEIIRERAKMFELDTKCYLGTNYSVDFYIIHENLMRLLEELDKISSDDKVLLDATVEVMSYIKSLMEQLDSNASSD